LHTFNKFLMKHKKILFDEILKTHFWFFPLSSDWIKTTFMIFLFLFSLEGKKKFGSWTFFNPNYLYWVLISFFTCNIIEQQEESWDEKTVKKRVESIFLLHSFSVKNGTDRRANKWITHRLVTLSLYMHSSAGAANTFREE
jgi:hypothetical protein